VDAGKRRLFLWTMCLVISPLLLGQTAVPKTEPTTGQASKTDQAQRTNQAGASPSVQTVPTESQKATSFEVASVRLSQPSDGEMTSIGEWGLPRFRVANANLRLLLCIAYGVNENQIVGAPGWSDSQNYVIDAKVEGDKGLSYEQMQPLIQQLLAERFHLQVHRETRNQQGYVLEVGKNGPKLHPSEGKADRAQIMFDQLQCPSCSMGTLAAILVRVTGRPVTDKTGVSGDFSIDLHYAPRDATDSPLPSVYVALQEQLGLKLNPQPIPVEMLVVDHVERNPTAD
jgi:uncharacterized protein (TIGR03435 family)